LRGAFLTFEGIDGCGKSTQAQLLAQRLRDYNFPVVETREPGGTEIGTVLRALLLDPSSRALVPSCELLLYLADRVQHLAQVIRPALAREDVVICDRYHDATLAYQHYGRGLDFAPLKDLIAAEIEPTPPALTLWLDANVDVAQARIAARGRGAPPHPPAEGRLEEEDERFHLRVQTGYAALFERHPQRIVRIDANAGADAVRDAIWDVIVQRFHVI
jgi:dTMP kinase